MAETLGTPPGWYWIVSVLALLWALAGIGAWYSEFTITPEKLAKLPPARQDAYNAMTFAPKAFYVLAVFAGLLGAILLLLRNAGAEYAFWGSLIGIVGQFGWFFVVFRGGQKLGWASAIFPAVILILCLCEIWFARYALIQGWLG